MAGNLENPSQFGGDDWFQMAERDAHARWMSSAFVGNICDKPGKFGVLYADDFSDLGTWTKNTTGTIGGTTDIGSGDYNAPSGSGLSVSATADFTGPSGIFHIVDPPAAGGGTSGVLYAGNDGFTSSGSTYRCFDPTYPWYIAAKMRFHDVAPTTRGIAYIGFADYRSSTYKSIEIGGFGPINTKFSMRIRSNGSELPIVSTVSQSDAWFDFTAWYDTSRYYFSVGHFHTNSFETPVAVADSISLTGTFGKIIYSSLQKDSVFTNLYDLKIDKFVAFQVSPDYNT